MISLPILILFSYKFKWLMKLLFNFNSVSFSIVLLSPFPYAFGRAHNFCANNFRILRLSVPSLNVRTTKNNNVDVEHVN